MNSNSIDSVSKSLWEKAKNLYLSSLEEDKKSQAELYFAQITSISRDQDTIIVKTENSFAAELLQSSYADKLMSCMNIVGDQQGIIIRFEEDPNSNRDIIIPEIEKKTNIQPSAKKRNENFISTMPLDPNYTFEEFVSGPSNSWAFSSAKGVVEHPGQKGYNPLFIHGGTGLGKTHLMQAIGNELHKRNPDLFICYITAETFLNEYISLLQNSQISSFRDKYRSCDVLLIDDVQFLQKGGMIQEEFFNTFNNLTAKNKQIVLTSDVAPKNLPKLDERLISRFVGGMVQEIELPTYETRLAILRRKAESYHPTIPNSTLEFLAQKIKSHVRAMEGALAKVSISMQLNPTVIPTSESLSYLLRDVIENEINLKKLTVKEIQEVVAKQFKIHVDDILSGERTSSLVTPRQMAMYISRKFATKSLQEIALEFKKSHATIIHGVKTIQKRIDVEEDLKHKLEDILSQFGYHLSDQIG